MAGPRRAPANHVYLANFAKSELDELVHDLWMRNNFETSPVVLLGALVLAARRLPTEVVQGLIPSYLERERAEMGKPPPED